MGRAKRQAQIKAFTISSVMLKGGAGKSFSIYMLVMFILEKLKQPTSNLSTNVDSVIVCDMDSQVSLIGKFEGFIRDRRTMFFLEEDSVGEKIKIKHQFPTIKEFSESSIVLIDNPPGDSDIWRNKELIDFTDLFIVPVNTTSALDRVGPTIKQIRSSEALLVDNTPAQILLVFNDTMRVHEKVFEGISKTLINIAETHKKVTYWGHINHSQLVSLAEIGKESIYKVLKHTNCGKRNRHFAKDMYKLYLEYLKGI